MMVLESGDSILPLAPVLTRGLNLSVALSETFPLLIKWGLKHYTLYWVTLTFRCAMHVGGLAECMA